MLKWARESGCEWDVMTCLRAAEEGYVDILRWLKENSREWCDWMCVVVELWGHL